MMQTIAWITTLIFILLIAIVFGWVVIRSKEKREYTAIMTKWYKTRKVYGITLVALLIIFSIYTLRELPYNAPAYGKGENPTIVQTEAMQFGWNIDVTEFSVGEQVEFHVTSADVTHGFGLYDEDMNLLEQTQAMPEYTNIVYYTFEEPGTYKILCLEYCGVGHHVMDTEIVVN